MADRFVTYRRVSTQRQGTEGYSLEQQLHDCKAYIERNQGTHIKDFEEIESGGKNNRPQLLQALNHCQLTHSTLLVAKLDRLTRNLYLFNKIKDTGVKFRSLECPDMSEAMLGVLISIASLEREMIRDRIKKTFQYLKKKGWKPNPKSLENLKMKEEVRTRGVKASVKSRTERRKAADALLCPKIKDLLDKGLGWSAIARALNAEGIVTSRGRPHNCISVKVIWKRNYPARNIPN